MKKKSLKSAFMVGTVILGLGIGTLSAHAWSIMYPLGIKGTPVTIYPNSTLASATITDIGSACSEWNNAGCGTRVNKSSTTTSTTTFPLLNNKNEITKGARGTNEYLMGLYPTQEDFSTSRPGLIEGDIDINTSHPWANSPSSTQVDVRSAITHELGHLLGLGHSSSSTATMYESMTYGETHKRTLEQDDKSGLDMIY